MLPSLCFVSRLRFQQTLSYLTTFFLFERRGAVHSTRILSRSHSSSIASLSTYAGQHALCSRRVDLNTSECLTIMPQPSVHCISNKKKGMIHHEYHLRQRFWQHHAAVTEYALPATLFSSLFLQGKRYMVVGQPTALGHKTPLGESSL